MPTRGYDLAAITASPEVGMDLQNQPAAPTKETTDESAEPKPRERGLDGIDTKPILRRLTRMVGKPWVDVRAKIDAMPEMPRRDFRTAYNRFLGENVAMSEDIQPAAAFYVDANGRLTRRDQAESTDRSVEPTVLSPETMAFLGKRVIGVRGETLFWFDRIGSPEKKFAGNCPRTGKPLYLTARKTTYRQGSALSSDEVATFEGFPEAQRAKICFLAPDHSPAPTVN